ncbi:MAG: hypothetical protein GEV03_17440 [Streptosporangiales bacterium]|nr:hypothetical protein [Streptosporangiales bacterium]
MNQRINELLTDFRSGFLTRRGFLAKAGAFGVSAAAASALIDQGEASAAVDSPADVLSGRISSGRWEVVDLSVTTAENHPTNWPTDPLFHVVPMTWFDRIPGPNGSNSGAVEASVAAVQRYEITEHTGTQMDFPPHFIPPPGVSVDGAPSNEYGRKTGDKFELTEFFGPAVVVDVRELLEAHTQPGTSARITPDWLRSWERRHGRIGEGEVPMWFSGYTDRYYRRFPENDRFQDRMLWKPLVEKSEPGWVAAHPDTVEMLHERGVRHVVTDGPSFGAADDGQGPHVAGLQYGMSYTENAINLGKLPVRGAFYIAAPYKVADQQAAIARAFAIKSADVPGILDA